MSWIILSDTERYQTLRAMEAFGGSFASTLAKAWMRADEVNSNALGQAFPELVKEYGPDSLLHNSV